MEPAVLLIPRFTFAAIHLFRATRDINVLGVAEVERRFAAGNVDEYAWVYLFAATDPLTGRTSAMLAPGVDTAFMNLHLRFTSEAAAPAEHVVLVLDGAAGLRARPGGCRPTSRCCRCRCRRTARS